MTEQMRTLKSTFFDCKKQIDKISESIGEIEKKMENKLKLNINQWQTWEIEQIICWIYNLKDEQQNYPYRIYCSAKIILLFNFSSLLLF